MEKEDASRQAMSPVDARKVLEYVISPVQFGEREMMMVAFLPISKVGSRLLPQRLGAQKWFLTTGGVNKIVKAGLLNQFLMFEIPTAFFFF